MYWTKSVHSVSDSESADVDSSTAAKVLLGDETVVRELRPAWAAYTGPLLLISAFVLGGFLFTVGISVLTRDGNGAPLFLLLPVILFGGIGYGLVYLARMQTRYIVTDKRVLKVKGLLNKTTHSLWLRDITAIKTRASAYQRLTGYGSVTVGRQPISWLQRIPLLPFGDGLRFGAVPDLYDVAEVIEHGSDRLR